MIAFDYHDFHIGCQLFSLMKHETGIWHMAFYSDARLSRARPLRESLRRDRATWQRTINGIGKTTTRDRIRPFFVNRLLGDCIYNFSNRVKIIRPRFKADSVRKMTRPGVHFAVDLYR